MTAYHNENDAFAADWLEALIKEGLIASGVVDRRSILDVRPVDLNGFTQCHFFAGIGGWPLALKAAGWPDHRAVWTGSCPCQPFSVAGRKGGFADERHLWPFWRYLIAQCRPAKIYGEQVASAAEWLRLVRGDLEAMDYAVGAIPIEAASAGADHLRDRYWFVGHSESERRNGSQDSSWSPRWHGFEGAGSIRLADTDELSAREEGQQRNRELSGIGGDPQACAGDVSDASREQVGAAGQSRQHNGMEWVIGADRKARRVKPGVRLLAHGIPNRVGTLRGFGNAIDPRPAAAFIRATM